MEKVVWKWEYGVYLPFCPYCGEPAYNHDECFACGNPYKWVDGQYKATEVRKGEYAVVQATNNHIHIYKGGRMVLHSACTVKKTDTELLAMIDRYIALGKSGAFEKLWEDESEE